MRPTNCCRKTLLRRTRILRGGSAAKRNSSRPDVDGRCACRMNDLDRVESQPSIERARKLVREGSLAEADAVLLALLVDSPGDPDGLYLRGLIANKQRDHARAIGLLRESIAARPQAIAWLALGN